MIVFVLYELCKGEDSFWYPFFEITDKPDLLTDWSEKDLYELQDQSMKQRTLDDVEEIEDSFEVIRSVAEQHPDIFNLAKFTLDQFKLAKNIVDTRCFGYSLPCNMLVPFADCANHHVVDMTVEVYNHRL